MSAMGKWFNFNIPENMGSVLNSFIEALRPHMDREHDGSPPVALFMEGPRTKMIPGPDGDIDLTEIVVTGFQTKGAPIPSELEPRYCIAGWKDEWVRLEEVMEFRFSALGSETRVRARCAEHISTVQRVFEIFLRQIEAYYPAVGPLWLEYRKKCERQREEYIDKYLNMESGDSGGAAVAAIEDEPVTKAGDNEGETHSQPSNEAGAEQEPTKQGPTIKTKLRAELFKQLKDAHPEWGYDAVAQHAAEMQKDNSITSDTVRNAYRAMGWKWERPDRIR